MSSQEPNDQLARPSEETSIGYTCHPALVFLCELKRFTSETLKSDRRVAELRRLLRQRLPVAVENITCVHTEVSNEWRHPLSTHGSVVLFLEGQALVDLRQGDGKETSVLVLAGNALCMQPDVKYRMVTSRSQIVAVEFDVAAVH